MSGPSSQSATSNARLIRRLLGLTWTYRWRCIVVFSYQLVLLVLGLAGLGLTGLAVDVVAHHLQPMAPLPDWFSMLPLAKAPATHAVLLLGALVLLMAAVRARLNYVYSVQVADLVQMQVVPALRTRVFEKLQRLSFRFFDEHASGGLINRVTSDVQSLRSFIDGVLIQGGIMLLSLLVYVAYMLAKHPALACLTLLPTPLLWFMTARFSRRVQPAYASNRQRTDELVLAFSEAVEGMQVAKVFAAEASQLAGLELKNRAVFESQRRVLRDVSRFSALVDGTTHLNLLLLLGFGGYWVSRGAISLGDLVVFAGLLQQFAAQVSRAAGVVNTLQQSLTGARRVYEVLDARSDVEPPASGGERLALQGSIRFEHVSFRYGDGPEVLSNIDFEVSAGTCVAIVGEMGAGKSTLLSLIPRFYDPGTGLVLLDGNDVRQLSLDDTRRQIGVVFQSNLLFEDSVRRNIAFGHPDTAPERIERAASAARAHDFITRLPDGYATKIQPGASNLSGGQRQRIALARALVLEPSILLLDDPTSGIDAETESELIDVLTRATRGRTTLIATHRIALAERADWIIVLAGGRIVEQGTHAELLRQGGVYRRAAALQAGVVCEVEGGFAG